MRKHADAEAGNDRDPSRAMAAPAPRELIIAAASLVIVMLMTSVALWFVAGAIEQERGQSSDVLITVPTNELLQTLADDLGPHATSDDLNDAVAAWLNAQTNTETQVLVASTLRGA